MFTTTILNCLFLLEKKLKQTYRPGGLECLLEIFSNNKTGAYQCAFSTEGYEELKQCNCGNIAIVLYILFSHLYIL